MPWADFSAAAQARSRSSGLPMARSSRVPLLLAWLLLLLLLRLGARAGAESEMANLLAFKAALEDPGGALENWNTSIPVCSWSGVQCSSNSSGGGEVVTGLNISSADLSGPLVPAFCNIPTLQVLLLYNMMGISGSFPDGLFNCTGLTFMQVRLTMIGGELPDKFAVFQNLVTLDLGENYLTGSMPPSIGELWQLQTLVLQSNLFTTGGIPTEYGKLARLQTLLVYYNAGLEGSLLSDFSNLTQLQVFRADMCSNLTGTIPDSIGSTQLTVLNLGSNLLTGSIPESIGRLTNLTQLDLSGNKLTGPIPASVGSLRNLALLHLGDNQLNGSIPDLSNLTRLQDFQALDNFLSGSIPDSIGNLTALQALDLSGNLLTGSIPDSVSKLKNLETLYLGRNQLSGSIPQSITELTSLKEFSFDFNQVSGPLPSGMGKKLVHMEIFSGNMNQLSGEFPQDVGEWSNLTVFALANNSLTGSVPEAMAGLTKLTNFSIFSNLLSGPFWPAFGANSPLQQFEIAYNSFSGPVPWAACNAGTLRSFGIESNAFSGPFPASYANCSSLQGLRTDNNSISGSFPKELWASPTLVYIDISNNLFNGSIPPEAGASPNRTQLLMSNNRFSGPIPPELGNLASLVRFNASYNSLEGAIPASLGNLTALQELFLESNRLSDAIPSELGNCGSLAQLVLSKNLLSGSIPASLADLSTLSVLDLSDNNLSGAIPPGFRNTLSLFNVSSNDLSGPIPPAFDAGGYGDSFLDNPGLCGPGVRACPSLSPGKRSTWGWLWVTVAAAVAALALAATPCCLAWRRFLLARQEVADADRWSFKSFQDLWFEPEEVLAGLRGARLIGAGASGQVYKVQLRDGTSVAAKLLPKPKGLQSEKKHADHGFEAEVQTQGRNTRHRHIVKLLCSGATRDWNMLVFEYMPHGSLGDRLHAPPAGNRLDWHSRFRIAVGVADALAHLHHHAPDGQILHRDVKANNILLDADFEACLSDFGLAKMLNNADVGAADDAVTGVAGSRGYIAPEYSYTNNITEKSDIYSFGVVLLELVTGRKPLDAKVFGEGVSLAAWAANQWEKGVELRDITLVTEWDDSMLHMLQLGLLCTNLIPTHRPSMQEVVEILHQCQPPGPIWKQEAKGEETNLLLSNVNQGELEDLFLSKHV